MNVNFSCLHTHQSLFTDRLYVALNSDESAIKKSVIVDGKEKTGLGMTEYGPIIGRLLTLLGFAFKSKDEKGNNLYINKNSFCNLVHRLYKNNQNYDFCNVEFIENEYHAKKNQEDQVQIKRIRELFETIISLSDRNIGELSFSILKRII